MTPLDATATRAAIDVDQLNPDLPVVQVTLVFRSVTPTAANLRAFLAGLGGIPRVKNNRLNTVSLAATYEDDPNAEANSSNLLSNRGADENTTGWEAKGAGSIARITSDSFADSAGCFEVTCPGSGANEGILLAASIPVPWAVGAGALIHGGCWVKSVSGSTALRTIIEQRDSGDSVAATATADVTAPTTAWGAINTFGVARNASLASLRIGAVTQGTTAAVFLVDGFFLACPAPAVASDSVNFNALGNSPGIGIANADPTIWHLTLARPLGRGQGSGFTPERIYDAADNIWGTVATDKDSLARGSYIFTITA
jgi:hypothetical protein